MKPFDCITIGGTVLDTFVMLSHVDHRPDPHQPEKIDQCFILGAKTNVKQIVQQSGGGASNASTTFARQRLRSALLSQVGEDAAAKLVLDEMEHDGVITGYVQTIPHAKTGQSVVLVDPDARRTVLLDRGSAGTLTAQTLAVLDGLSCRWVYLTSQNGSMMALETIFAWANDAGVQIAWNPGLADITQAKRSLKKFVTACSLLILNTDEAQQWLDSDAPTTQLAHQLGSIGARRAIVTNGSQPLAVIDGTAQWTLTPHHVKAIDETGAGDALGSGTVAGLLQGLSFKASLELGLANSEHVIAHIGAKTGIMYRNVK